jgi:hypothetical protein
MGQPLSDLMRIEIFGCMGSVQGGLGIIWSEGRWIALRIEMILLLLLIRNLELLRSHLLKVNKGKYARGAGISVAYKDK